MISKKNKSSLKHLIPIMDNFVDGEIYNCYLRIIDIYLSSEKVSYA